MSLSGPTVTEKIEDLYSCWNRRRGVSYCENLCKGDKETDELFGPSTASGVVMTTNGSAERLVHDVSGMSR